MRRRHDACAAADAITQRSVDMMPLYIRYDAVVLIIYVIAVAFSCCRYAAAAPWRFSP